ncbi:hypothetical protein PENARI_c011G10694 [Penicillium arizonense]|uniref:Uncharacterized protein n=1 Tax=Penicillium arizonense TaxID=1835702 RepID=A0A1F5LFQ6_PENAI|nr:hypothetical protein PENARI_c011G10694 [Penicillium arizonense]OGE51947.1 hypothetical protein PENARI_c011G10694 [Penicillium arizonense]
MGRERKQEMQISFCPSGHGFRLMLHESHIQLLELFSDFKCQGISDSSSYQTGCCSVQRPTGSQCQERLTGRQGQYVEDEQAAYIVAHDHGAGTGEGKDNRDGLEWVGKLSFLASSGGIVSPHLLDHFDSYRTDTQQALIRKWMRDWPIISYLKRHLLRGKELCPSEQIVIRCTKDHVNTRLCDLCYRTKREWMTIPAGIKGNSYQLMFALALARGFWDTGEGLLINLPALHTKSEQTNEFASLLIC